jgi:hypothetical protein
MWHGFVWNAGSRNRLLWYIHIYITIYIYINLSVDYAIYDIIYYDLKNNNDHPLWGGRFRHVWSLWSTEELKTLQKVWESFSFPPINILNSVCHSRYYHYIHVYILHIYTYVSV